MFSRSRSPAPVFQEAGQRAVQVEIRRQRRDLAADVLERGDLDAGAPAARIVAVGGALESRPAAVEPVGLVGAVVLRGFKLGIEAAAPVGLHLLDFALGDHAFADEPVGVDFQRAGMVGDGLVHPRLGERGLVALVVAVAPVAEHVDHDRLLEFLPEFGRDLGREHDRLRIVAVDVEDRRLDHLGDVGGIRRRARIARIGGEADLIVDDEMQRAAGAVTAQPRQPEALRDHALPGERGVAVDQERHHADAVLRRTMMLILLGAHLAEHDRVDDFQMRGIGGQRQVHRVAVELTIRRGAEMVFHVAGAFDLVRGR